MSGVQMSLGLSKASDSYLYMQTETSDGSSSATASTPNIFNLCRFSLLFFCFLSDMGDQRPLFRFRLPWLSAAAAPRPAAAPAPRPAAEPQPQPPVAAQTQAPSQPSTAIPIRRPPFRPAGIAPVQTIPPQAEQQKTEPQPAVPASPPRVTSQIRAASVPPSPSRRATEIQVASRPVSTFRAPTQARTASVPPSPPRIASQPQPTAVTVSKQSPPRLASRPAGQTSQPSSPSRSATQVQPLSPPKISATATSTQLPSSTLQKTTFRPFGAALKPSEASDQPKEIAPIPVAAVEAPAATAKPREREEKKKVAEKRRKPATKVSTHEEPEQGRITKLLAAATEAGTKTRELLGAALETGKRHLEKHEDVERKKIPTTSSTDEKQIKTVSSTFQKDESPPLHKEIREDISKFVRKLTTGQTKLPTDEKPVSVLTLAGENKGAFFHMCSESTKKDGLVHIRQGYKITPDDSSDATTDGEGSSSGRKPKDSMTKENPPPRAYVNSNTQSINNSFVSESSVNERNPGVHLDFLHNLEESTKFSAKPEPMETHKAEFNITPAEMLTYEPTVRRICFKGLFGESSDSDPDNPEMP